MFVAEFKDEAQFFLLVSEYLMIWITFLRLSSRRLNVKGYYTMNNEGVSNIPRTSVKISWNHGGKQVAIIGSWDNWETRYYFAAKMFDSGHVFLSNTEHFISLC